MRVITKKAWCLAVPRVLADGCKHAALYRYHHTCEVPCGSARVRTAMFLNVNVPSFLFRETASAALSLPLNFCTSFPHAGLFEASHPFHAIPRQDSKQRVSGEQCVAQAEMTIGRKQEMFPFRPSAVNIWVASFPVDSLSYCFIGSYSSCHLIKGAFT